MQYFHKNIYHRPLATPRPRFRYGNKVQCTLASPAPLRPGVLRVEPDRPFATTYPTYHYPAGSEIMPRHHH